MKMLLKSSKNLLKKQYDSSDLISVMIEKQDRKQDGNLLFLNQFW